MISHFSYSVSVVNMFDDNHRPSRIVGMNHMLEIKQNGELKASVKVMITTGIRGQMVFPVGIVTEGTMVLDGEASNVFILFMNRDFVALDEMLMSIGDERRAQQ